MSDMFLEEYSADAALPKYRSATAGYGISYLLDNDYGAIYRYALEQCRSESPLLRGTRVLEFGCGAGMNLIHVVSMIERRGDRLEQAYGTDFSEKLLEAGRTDADRILRPAFADKVKFLVARNETIIDDMAAALNVPPGSLHRSFDLVFGVNTFRYCYRLDKENDSAQQLFDLVRKGGVCVMIDMNAQFRLFRSQLRRKENRRDREFYIPVLEEYARPFAAAGFEILVMRNFCWMPHSAGPILSRICRILTPALNVVASRYAMRSLVIAKKLA